MSHSDVISVHLNFSNEMRNFFEKNKIDKMKKNCIFINTSRGEVVNEDDLFKALKNKKIGGAGIDVFNQEPYSGPLQDLNNVILTPHIGSYAREVRMKMELEAANNVITGLNEV